MMDNIGVTDSELRDALIYTTLSHLIMEDWLSPSQLKKLLDISLDDDRLFYRLGEQDTDSVFTRSFSVLIVAEVFYADRRRSFLPKDKVFIVKERLVTYVKKERDIRGYVVGKGWAHSIAHAADTLGEIGFQRGGSHMPVKLTPMSEETFNQYYQRSLKEYANEHVKAGNWKEEEAIQNAQKQFKQLLPEGLATKEHVLFSVLNDEKPIGILWLHIQSKTPDKQAFIYDIELEDDQRGKGLGKATMSALDEYAQSEGIKKISLHVFAHNQRAIALYEKMGYQMTDHHMSKWLS